MDTPSQIANLRNCRNWVIKRNTFDVQTVEQQLFDTVRFHRAIAVSATKVIANFQQFPNKRSHIQTISSSVYTHTRERKENWWRQRTTNEMEKERESSCTRLETCNDEQTFPVCFSVFDTSASNNKSCVVPSARVRTRTQNETNQPDVSYNNLSSTQFSQQLFHALPIPSSHFCVSSASSVPLVLTCS